MECENIKIEFPNYKYKSCCESCHEDDEMGYGEDLWFDDPNGKDRNVCCAIHRAWKEKEGKK